jgi:methyl-accepting chemotaxis protein
MNDKQSAASTAYSELYETLKNAYWSAETDESREGIRDLYEQVYAIKSTLNAEDIASRTEEYEKVTEKIKATNEELKKLSNEIGAIVNDTRIVANVVNGITKALSAAGGFLGK